MKNDLLDSIFLQSLITKNGRMQGTYTNMINSKCSK